jgi:hypothetical protein
MAHALTISRTRVAPDEREHHVGRMRARKAQYAAAYCRYWAFEDPRIPGDFVEFTEAADAAALARAHAAAADPVAGADHLLTEVELA